MNELDGIGEQKDARGPKKVVLVIDGKVKRQFYTSIHLQRMDYDVIMARTAEDALLFLELTVPLAVITNYDLPAMNGLVLLQYIKENELARNVPVIIYTSNHDPAVEKSCRESGCAKFLRHPCSFDELYAAVQSAAGGRPRKFVRLTTRLEVVIEDIEEERMDFISNLSEEGMFVSTIDPLPHGSIHTFAFHLPNAPGWVVRVQGQVLHMHLGSGTRKRQGMGVKFQKIGETEREFLKDFVKKEMMGELASD
jgi:CheY-like chemotaxis protein